MSRIYMIGNTHFDPAWLWTWDEAMASIRATFRAALDRMAEDSDFRYSFCTPAVFEWIEQTDPDLFAEIRQRAAEGRWDVAAEGWWLQPDCNAPSGESLIRQGLYGQRYLMEHFGLRATTVFNFDSFGHSAMMPQILKKCGLDYYVFTRPSPPEQPLEKELFVWKAPDGSEVLAFRADAEGIGAHSQQTDAYIRSYLDKLSVCGHDLMLVYGVSDHGGAPTVKAIRDIHRLQKELPDVGIRMAGTTDFFSAQDRSGCVRVTGELMTRYYGVFSNRPGIKRANRRAEYALSRAEAASCFADRLCGIPYPLEKLRQCWKDVLFNQFHDILGGACIEECCEDARNLHGRAIQTAGEITHFALQSITRQIQMPGSNDDAVWNLCVFNPASTPFSDILEAEVQWAWEFPWYTGGIELIDENGTIRQTQIVTEKSKIPGFRSRFAFHADIPALGYRTYAVRKTGVPVLREHGDPADLSPFRFRAFEDAGDVWCFNSPEGYGPMCENPVCESRRTVEKGTLLTTVKQTWRFRDSLLEEYITTYTDSDAIDYRYRIHWNEAHTVLKLIPTLPGGKPSRILAAIPGGSLSRPADGREYPVGEWMQWENGENGVTLLLDGIFAYDTDALPQLTLVRSPICGDLRIGELDAALDYTCQDQGIHTGRIRVIPHALSAGAAAAQASQWNMPPVIVCEANHGGSLPPTAAGLCMESSHAVLTALKRAEAGNGYIVRLTEYDGIAGSIQLRLAGMSPVEIGISPYEIKTLFFSDDGTVRETDMLEDPAHP